MRTEAQPIAGTFFGFPFSLPFVAGVLLMFSTGVFCTWNLRSALTTGMVNWRNDTYSKAEDPKMFALFLGVYGVISLCAFAGGVGMLLDLGMKP